MALLFVDFFRFRGLVQSTQFQLSCTSDFDSLTCKNESDMWPLIWSKANPHLIIKAFKICVIKDIVVLFSSWISHSGFCGQFSEILKHQTKNVKRNVVFCVEKMKSGFLFPSSEIKVQNLAISSSDMNIRLYFR